jgi:hypothetical protein
MLRTVPIALTCLITGLAFGPASAIAQPGADEVCTTVAVDGGRAQVCARRDGFGAAWTAQVADTAEDGRSVSTRLTLDVADARDPSVELDAGPDGSVRRERGRLAPRVGTAIRSLTIQTCVDIRFAPDSCESETVGLPQPQPAASNEQLQRLDELIFGSPIDAFIETWAEPDRVGVDASFDWTSDGCSVGPLRDLFDESLQQACIRHDFAYRNLGQMGLAATDEVRARVDAQLAADIEAVDQGRLATGFQDALQRFGGPVFYGEELGPLWGVPDFIVRRISTPELADERTGQ